VLAGLTGLVGLVTGLVAGLAVRATERAQQKPVSRSGPNMQAPLPPGVASVLSVLSSSAVVVDAGDRVLRASSAARAFGLVKEDRLLVSELLALARLVRRDGEIREQEIEVAPGPGSRSAEGRWFTVRVAPLSSSGLVLVLAEDLTERRRVEAIRRDFVANVSHELKTPVGALYLLAETIEHAADDPQAVRRFAGRIQHESGRLTNLIQDLITLSRIQGGEHMAEPKQVALDDVVGEAVDRCRLKAAARDIELVVGGGQGLFVRGDEELLVTALRNLIDNAVGYSPERTRVAISTRAAGERNEISVTDQGIGIPEADRERIFERFYRVDPARSRQTGGTGLGLAIVKHVTTVHGGEVAVWSQEGAGSTFTIRLPLLTPAREDTVGRLHGERGIGRSQVGGDPPGGRRSEQGDTVSDVREASVRPRSAGTRRAGGEANKGTP
jgi:two-component system sensor histidine kinase SenX3